MNNGALRGNDAPKEITVEQTTMGCRTKHPMHDKIIEIQKKSELRGYIPNISGFVDFCSYHANGAPIYFVNGRLYTGFDMLCRIDYKYNFTNIKAQAEKEKAIIENMYMFYVDETDKLFYTNDNMFSMSNAQKHIKGQILTLKEKYR